MHISFLSIVRGKQGLYLILRQVALRKLLIESKLILLKLFLKELLNLNISTSYLLYKLVDRP